MEQWLIDHWSYCIAGFWALEKLVKITPTKYDDILVDVLWGALKRIVGKK